MTDKVQKICEIIEKRYEYWKEKELNSHSIESEIRMSECQHLLLMINSLQEEPVSEDLKKFAEEWDESLYRSDAVIAGADWKERQMMKDAVDIEVKIDAGGYPYIPIIELYDYYDKNMPLAKAGDKVKVKIFKED